MNGNIDKTGIDKRQLTKAELKRKELFEQTEKDLAAQGYTRVDVTVSVAKANTLGVLVTLPILAVVTIAFALYNRGLRISTIATESRPYSVSMMIFVISFVILVVVHEGIHGLCWSIGAPGHLKDIEFGFIVKMLTPYCTCKTPLTKPFYIFGSLMPMTLLGIIPGIVSIFLGDFLILAIALVQILAGAGDLLISLMLLRHKSHGKDTVLIDHPYECGSVLFER